MSTTDKPLIPKDAFRGLEEHIWLYTGAESPPHRGVCDAVNEYLLARTGGPAGRERNAEVEASCKENLAALLGGTAEQIALISNASEAISAIAQSIDWRAGDNVVINTLEFPSGVLPWLSLQKSGVEVRVAEHHDWNFSTENILSHVDASTRLVMTSQVSYLSGARLDPRALYGDLQKTDALLLLDATQALGVVPVAATHADFVVSSTYKWLLAMHGAGVLAINPARAGDLLGRAGGWRSVREMFGPNRFASFELHADARRFESGYPSYPTLYGLNFSSRLLLETGVGRIESHVHTLGTQLIAGLEALNLRVMTPRDERHRAGNICWVCPRGEELAAALRDEGVLIWGGDGRARASIHAFNESRDIEKLLAALKKHQGLLS